MLILVWLHGCLGIHFWLRLRPWYRALQPWLFALALLLPTLALIGFANAGRELRARATRDPAWLERLAAAQNWLDPAQTGWIYDTERRVLLGFTVVLVGVLGARTIRSLRARYGRRHRLDRAGDERARGDPRSRRAACLGVRRARPLLDLPDARALPVELGASGGPAAPAFAQLISLGRRALRLAR